MTKPTRRSGSAKSKPAPRRRRAKPKPAPQRHSVVDLANGYFLERAISPKYREQFDVVLRAIRKWHGDMVHADDFTDDFVNLWLAHEAKLVGPETLKNRRRMILTLWRYAWDRELIADMPRRIRSVRVPPKIPSAWTAEEVQRLLVAADDFCLHHVHPIAKCRTRLFWRAMIMVVWDSALRRVDWERLKRSDIGDDGVIVLVQHKTDWPLKCTLRPETVAAIDATNPTNREFIFGSGSSQRCRSFKRIVTVAGLTGSLKKLRKSSATAVERLQPGAAMAHLGHKTPGLAARHYIDPRLTQATKIQPPSLSQTAPVAEQPKPEGDILAWI
jgi:integrase